MQHPLDQHPDALCADLLAQTGDNPLQREACFQASAVWDGDPTRPRGVRAALVLCEMKADPDTLLAATLGDPRLRASFNEGELAAHYGAYVARMVAELHRLNTFSESQAAFENPQQAENMRRLLLAMVSDVRVILIKLAYRLERLRALPLVDDPVVRQSVARETLDILAPIAHRLGLGQLKWELEDLAFRHLEPETYKRIASLLDEKRVEREGICARYASSLIARCVLKVSPPKCMAAPSISTAFLKKCAVNSLILHSFSTCAPCGYRWTISATAMLR